MLYFEDCKAQTVLVQTYKNISGGGGLSPPHPLLNTALLTSIGITAVNSKRVLNRVLVQLSKNLQVIVQVFHV